SFDSHAEIRDVVSGSLTLQELILQNSDSVVNYAGDENVPKIRVNNSVLDISKAVLLADFKDLYVEKDGIRIEATNVEATWEVPSINEELGSIYILHYSNVRDVYELIVPKEIDYDNHLITAFFEDLSPVAVFYIEDDSRSTNYLFWILLLIVLMFAVFIVSGKKKHEQ
ncbi:MAG: hypothetical protein ACI4WM_06680, partial [Erysipelotrichaceae bacterium]